MVFTFHVESENIKEARRFCNWLKEKMLHIFLKKTEHYDFRRFDDYINSLPLKFNYSKRWLSAKNILIIGIKTLKVEAQTNLIIMSVDTVKNLPYTYMKLSSLVNLINYGNMNINGYPIYDDIFNYMASNINSLYEQFFEES